MMDKIIPVFYKAYGDKVNLERMIPLEIDGLKPVERRVLVSLYELTKNKFVKSAKICGNTLSKYHPHGDVYGTLVEMVRHEFAEGQGNWGCFSGIEKSPPAALRYTECKLADITRNISFSLIDYVPKVTNDLEPEPEFLPSMFPLCLIKKSFTIGLGFGYKTVIPCYRIEDLYKRLLFLLGKGKEFIPYPFSNCDVVSDHIKIKELCETGRSKITFRGKIKIDTVNRTVNLLSWPYNISFSRIISKFQDEIQNGSVTYTDYSAEKTNVVFKLGKKIDINIFSDKLLNEVTGDTNFNTLVIDQNKMVVLQSIDSLLLSSYKNYSEISKRMLRCEIDNLDSKIEEFNVILKIRKPLSDGIRNKNIRSKQDIKMLLKDISKDTHINFDKIQSVISKYKISQMLTATVDVDDINEKRLINQRSLDNIDNFISDKYWSIHEKITEKLCE